MQRNWEIYYFTCLSGIHNLEPKLRIMREPYKGGAFGENTRWVSFKRSIFGNIIKLGGDHVGTEEAFIFSSDSI